MKRFFNFLKSNRTKIILAVAAIVTYILAHKAGTAERGYEAIGGEMFVPFVVLFAPEFWELIKAPFKAVKANELD